jgi:tripartite-type tricarboxylate transporter receptor subunit TctC
MHNCIALFLGLWSCLFTSLIWADNFPIKPIRWIVTSPAGDGGDVTGRLIADKVSKLLNQPITIDNKPGAGGIIGSEIAAKSLPDGYTMVVGNAGSHSITPALYKNLNYDPVHDFAPVGLFCTAPNVMVISPSIHVASVAEFITFAKKQGRILNYGSGGIGSSAHMSGELFKSLAGLQLFHIPYKGTVPAATALASGEVDVLIANLPGILTEFIKAGRIQALAVSSNKRVGSFPELPTLKETIPEFETVAWYGLFVPVATPKDIISKMNGLINQALAMEEVKRQFANIGCQTEPGSEADFAARVDKDVSRWRKLALENNIKAN